MDSNGFLLGNREDVAAGLRLFRAKNELSQSELAILSGVSLRTIQSERTRANPLTLMRLDSLMRRYERGRKKVAC